MQANRRTDTTPELQLRSALHKSGLRFRKDHRIDVAGLRVRPDVVFLRARVAVFVDGCFWHRCPEHGAVPVSNSGYWTSKLSRNIERDREVDAALMSAGWRALRYWEHAVRADSASVVEEVGAIVRASLAQR